jgi:hypothetical protein
MIPSSRVSRAVIPTLAAAIAWSAPTLAQDEAALKSAFERQRVVVRIDMPGNADGIDVRADQGGTIDQNHYRNDLKRYGTAIRAGDAVTVTLIKLKKDLIEFQLDGGGFGTFGDDTSTSVNMPDLPPTEREKGLEKRIKDESNSDRKKALQRELDDLRRAREAQNSLIRAERTRQEQRKREQVAENRLRGGSRFNVRFKDHVPPDFRADDMRNALAEFVDFRGDRPGDRPGERPSMFRTPPGAGAPQLRKGMLRADAEQLLGRPSQSSQKSAGEFTVVTLVFVAGEQRVTADFVEDVLVRYAISSR